jgi:hypothetical protein
MLYESFLAHKAETNAALTAQLVFPLDENQAINEPILAQMVFDNLNCFNDYAVKANVPFIGDLYEMQKRLLALESQAVVEPEVVE